MKQTAMASYASDQLPVHGDCSKATTFSHVLMQDKECGNSRVFMYKILHRTRLALKHLSIHKLIRLACELTTVRRWPLSPCRHSTIWYGQQDGSKKPSPSTDKVVLIPGVHTEWIGDQPLSFDTWAWTREFPKRREKVIITITFVVRSLENTALIG